MGLLKDQLEKLGLRPTWNENSEKNYNEQERKPKPKLITPSQGSRNHCESCDKIAPDVEFYDHQNKVLRAKWLCTRCADRFAIHDDFRRSAQSDFSKKRAFRREYGPTHSWNRLKHIMAEFDENNN